MRSHVYNQQTNELWTAWHTPHVPCPVYVPSLPSGPSTGYLPALVCSARYPPAPVPAALSSWVSHTSSECQRLGGKHLPSIPPLHVTSHPVHLSNSKPQLPQVQGPGQFKVLQQRHGTGDVAPPGHTLAGLTCNPTCCLRPMMMAAAGAAAAAYNRLFGCIRMHYSTSAGRGGHSYARGPGCVGGRWRSRRERRNCGHSAERSMKSRAKEEVGYKQRGNERMERGSGDVGKHRLHAASRRAGEASKAGSTEGSIRLNSRRQSSTCTGALAGAGSKGKGFKGKGVN